MMIFNNYIIVVKNVISCFARILITIFQIFPYVLYMLKAVSVTTLQPTGTTLVDSVMFQDK
jgi:hypothetical protein